MPELANAHAFIVGIANYQNINPLPDVVLKDARDIRDLLIDANRCAYPPTNVTLVIDQEATAKRLRDELDILANRTDEESTVFIYISSHGGHVNWGAYAGEYLLPVDVDYSSHQSIAETAISGEMFSEALRKITAHKIVVVFDCCHAAGIGDIKGVHSPLLKGGLPEEYYELLKAGRGRVIMASSRSTESSYVLTGASNSLFTEHFLEALRGGAPAPGGLIRVFDVFDYVQRRVSSSGVKQHPIFKAELEENFPLALYQGGKAPVMTVSPPLVDEFVYDLFISYRQQEPDQSWVLKSLLPRLKAAGLRVCIDFECFRPGRFVVTEMERAVRESRYTVCVLSPAYLNSGFTEFEALLSQHLGVGKRQTRYLGVMREPCSPRLRMRARFWLDMTNDDEFEQNVTRLIYQARQPPTN